jgi:CzcA family heavy metal efflux pump
MAMMFIGVTQLSKMPVDVLPEFTPPHVEIQTEALGLSATEVEQMVTVPLEQDLLNGVPWLDKIRSQSVPGLSEIDLIFQSGTDVLRARQMVQERITQARALPNVSKPPAMIQPVSSTGRVMMIGLSSKNLSLIDMSVLARWQIRPRLMGVPGVANVAIWGQRERQLQVQVDPAKLRANGVTLTQVISTTGNALWESPLSFLEASSPGTGGFIDTSNQRLGVQHVSPIATAKDLAQVTVEDTVGRTLRLSDVSQVVEDHQPLIGDAVINGGPGLVLVVEKFPGANTLDVTRDVDKALDSLRPGLPGMTIDANLFRPASFIETATHNLTIALLLGGLLVALALGALFFSWRSALVSLVAIPLSLLAAGLVLYVRGATMNTMVLAGLVAAVGVVVDEAIVDVENIVRRLREHRSPGADTSEGADRSTMAIVLEAALQVRGPMVYATLITLITLVPLFFLTGLTGSFIRPLLVSYGLAVLAAMAVALTVTPALASVLSSTASARRRESPLVRWLQRGHQALAARTTRRPGAVYAGVAVLTLVGLALLPGLARQSIVPPPQDRSLLISWAGTPGTSQPEMVRITDSASQALRSIPGIRNVGAHIGRAVTSDQLVGVNSGEMWVSIDPAADYNRTVAAINNVLDDYPGLRRQVQSYPEQQTRESLTGSTDQLVVRLYGEDLGILQRKAEEVRQLMSHINGVVTPHVDLQAQEPSVQIEVDLTAAQRYGIKPGDVRRAAATLLSGIAVGSLFEDQKVFDVVVWGAPGVRNSLTSIRDLLIDTPAGGQVRLADVAAVSIKPAPDVIRHDNVSRSIDIGANVHGRDVAAVTSDVKDRLKRVTFPLEYHAELLGDQSDRATAWRRVLVVAAAATIAILLLLQVAFGSWRLAAVFFLTLPMALVGGVLAASLDDRVLSLGSLAGFLAVLGIAVRGGIMMVKHCQYLAQRDGEASGPGLVLRAARERVAPILMTALATALAVLPLALLRAPGPESVHPVAVVILGGLVTSTLFSIFVVPVVYLSFGPDRGRNEPDRQYLIPG